MGLRQSACGRCPKPMGNARRDLLRAAVHQAGHVVAEYALGHRIRSVRLDVVDGGVTWLGWRASRPTEDALVAALAGPAAEALWLGVPLEALIGSSGSEHDRVAVGGWLEPGEDQSAYERVSVALMEGRWAALSRVAAALAVRRRLGHRQVMGLLLTARRRELTAPVRAGHPGRDGTDPVAAPLDRAA